MDGMTSDNGVISCHNMRGPAGGAGLEPVGRVSAMAEVNGVPLVVDSKGCVLVYDESTGVLTSVGDGGELETVGTMTGGHAVGVDVGGGVVISTDDGMWRAVRANDGKLRLKDDIARPGLSLRAVTVARIDGTMPGHKLKGSYTSRSNVLNVDDLATVSEDYRQAYLDALSKARAGSMMLGHVIARYRLRGMSGETLFVSPPLLLSGGLGDLSVVRGMSGAGGTMNEVLPKTVSFDGFRVEVGAPSGIDGDVVNYIEVMMTPMLLPVDMNGLSECHIDDFSGTSAVMTVSLPGCTLANRIGGQRQRVIDALDRLDTLETCVARIYPSQLADGGTVMAVSGFTGRSSDFVTEVGRRLSKSVVHDRSMEARFRAPHSFSAGCVARNGDILVWGDLTSRRFGGFTPNEYAVGLAKESSWRGYTMTRDESGVSVVTKMGVANAPVEFSPLITYPLASVREVELRTVVNGVSRSGCFPMQPVANGSMAYYLSDDLDPVTLDPDNHSTVEIPTGGRVCDRFPGHVAVTRVSDPLNPILAGECSAKGVDALTVSVRGVSTLDFGRSHFYAFGPEGIMVLSVNKTRDAMSVSLLDPRRPGGRQAVAVTPQGVVTSVGDLIVTVSGSKVKGIARVKGCIGIGYSALHDEIWCVNAVGDVTVIDNKGRCYTRDDIKPESMLTTGGMLYMASEGTLYNDRETAGDVPVEWCMRQEMPVRLTGVGFAIASSSFKGSLTVSGDGGAGFGHSLPLVSLAVEGEVNHPVYARVVAPPRRVLTVTVKGRCGVDTTMDYVSLDTVK